MIHFSFHPEMFFVVPTICVGEIGCECCGENAGFAIGFEFLCFGLMIVFGHRHDDDFGGAA